MKNFIVMISLCFFILLQLSCVKATITIIQCVGVAACKDTTVNVVNDWTLVRCVGNDACQDAKIKQKKHAKHVLVYCNGDAACKGDHGIDSDVTGDDWTVSCYAGSDVCVNWDITNEGATKCDGISCPTTLVQLTGNTSLSELMKFLYT
jgi:hypothetical protein